MMNFGFFAICLEWFKYLYICCPLCNLLFHLVGFVAGCWDAHICLLMHVEIASSNGYHFLLQTLDFSDVKCILWVFCSTFFRKVFHSHVWYAFLSNLRLLSFFEVTIEHFIFTIHTFDKLSHQTFVFIDRYSWF